MGKRIIALFSLLCLSLVLSFNLISAYGYYFPSLRYSSENVIYSFIEFFDPILSILFGGYGGWSSQYTFETLLLFIVLVTVIYIIMGKISIFEKSEVARWIVSIAIPLIGVRFMRYDWLEAVFSQYQLVTVAIGSILPLVIYFYFLYNIAGEHGIIRKFGWALWVAVYFGLWSDSSYSPETSAVYFWTMIVGLICLLFDNFIQRRLILNQQKERNKDAVYEQITAINEKIAKEAERIGTGTSANIKASHAKIKGLREAKKIFEKQLG